MIKMVGFTEFFGADEWGSMFLASFLLTAITGFFLLSRTLIWACFGLFLVAFLFTGYKLFFDKKNPKKGDISEFKDTLGVLLKK